ncbi:MAG: hypothetical protein RSA41_07645, partial [Christensenella sp.]
MKKVLIVVLCVVLACGVLVGCKSTDYNKAVEFQESGDYASALILYEGIDDYENYKDTAARVNECKTTIEAIEKYDVAKSGAEKKNTEIDAAIAEAKAFIAEGQIAIDDTLVPTLETTISEAKASKKSIVEMPSNADEIIAVSKELDKIDYSGVLTNLSDKKAALEKSIKQYALVNAPTEAYIIECLGDVQNVIDISAVTEDNDPNGNLNKAGGYTAQVYFSSDSVDQNDVYGSSI